jgi:hypothetical protein
MSARPTAAQRARQLLHVASRRLNTADPAAVGELNHVLEASMPLPAGDPAYRNRMLLEPRFSETDSEALSFIMDTGGPGATLADQAETATRAMRRIVGSEFGPQALRWLDNRLEPVRGRSYRALRMGACLGSGFDRNGMTESLVSYEWGPDLMDSLPASLFQLARAAVESLPGLTPVMSTIRCGRSSGSQQITFEVDQALPLSDLRPLMDRLGLGHQHPSLMTAVAFILGARFTLPPDVAMLTMRPTRVGIEMRLDIDLDALPDPPPMLVSLMRLQMSERPRSLRALDRWLGAITPDGFETPGDVALLSIWVRPDLPARVALYIRPSVLHPAESLAPGSNGGAPVSAPGNGRTPVPAGGGG